MPLAVGRLEAFAVRHHYVFRVFGGRDPTKYKDEYREALQALIDAKIAGREVTTLPSESPGAPTIDLMSALSASVEAASQGRQRARNPAAASGTALAKGGAAKGGSGEDGPAEHGSA